MVTISTKKNYLIRGHLVAVQPLATCSKDLADREGGNDKPTPIPSCDTEQGKRLMFPATGLRGTLRRACLAAVRDIVSEHKNTATPFSLDEHYFLTLGGIKGAGEQQRNSVAHVAEWRNKNPLLSLFGAGDAGFLNFVTGTLNVGNAICVNATPSNGYATFGDSKDEIRANVFSGARTDEFYRNTEQVAFLSNDDIASLVERAKGGSIISKLKKEVAAAEKELKVAKKSNEVDQIAFLTQKISDLKEQVESAKEKSGTSDNSIGRPLAGYKAIPQGEQLKQELKLFQSTEIELGLLLSGLNHFSLFPFVGAHYANGCGQVAGSWTAYEITPSGKIEIGTINIGDFEPIALTGQLPDIFQSFSNFMESKQYDYSIPALKSTT